jgi:hypothetical protein
METLPRDTKYSEPENEVSLPDLVIGLARLQFSESQLASLPIAFGRGVDPWTAVMVGIHGRNLDGEDLPLLSSDDLEARLRMIGRLLQSDEPNAWLEGYAELVLAERRRRRKAVAA